MFFWCKIQLLIRTMFYIIDILIIANCNNSTGTEFKKILLQQFKDNNENKKNKYVNYRLQIQGDQKVSVHLMITILKVSSNVQSVPPPVSRHLLTCRAAFFKTVFSLTLMGLCIVNVFFQV